MSTLLVTGGAGYIGSHFVKAYLAQHPQDTVVIVDNLSEGHQEAIPQDNRVRFYPEEIGNIDRMQAILAEHRVEAVVHFAASCYVGESQENPGKYFQNNTINSLNLFQAMETAGVRRIVFSSTCATYGNPQSMPLDEQHPQAPINIYGLTKLMIEQALGGYRQTRGWSYAALRYFNAAGADDSATLGEHHEPETHLIPIALQVATGQRSAVEIYGNDYDTPDGTCIRDYIHVNDLADAHCKALALLATQPGGYPINLGTETGASVQEIITLCQDVTGKPIPTRVTARRPGDPPVLVAQSDVARQLLNWQPRYNLRRIIETAWAWEQNRRY